MSHKYWLNQFFAILMKTCQKQLCLIQPYLDHQSFPMWQSWGVRSASDSTRSKTRWFVFLKTRKNGSQNCIIRTHPNNPKHLQKRYLDPSKHTKNNLSRSIWMSRAYVYIYTYYFNALFFNYQIYRNQERCWLFVGHHTKKSPLEKLRVPIKVGETLMFLWGSFPRLRAANTAVFFVFFECVDLFCRIRFLEEL